MSAGYPDKEKAMGGLNEQALASVIHKAICEHSDACPATETQQPADDDSYEPNPLDELIVKAYRRKPLTASEADAEFDAAEPIPFKPGEVERLVAEITQPAESTFGSLDVGTPFMYLKERYVKTGDEMARSCVLDDTRWKPIPFRCSMIVTPCAPAEKSLGEILFDSNPQMATATISWNILRDEQRSLCERRAESVRAAVLEREGVDQLRAERDSLKSQVTDLLADMDTLQNRLDAANNLRADLERDLLAMSDVKSSVVDPDLVEQSAIASEVAQCLDASGSPLRVRDLVVHIDGNFGGVVSEIDGKWIRVNHEERQRRDAKHFRKVVVPDVTPVEPCPTREPEPVCRDCDGREIKIDHEVELVDFPGERRTVLGFQPPYVKLSDKLLWTSDVLRVVTPAEPTLVPWTDFDQIPLDACFRHKSGTTSKKIARFNAPEVNLYESDEWYGATELCEYYDYSLDGRDFKPCGELLTACT